MICGILACLPIRSAYDGKMENQVIGKTESVRPRFVRDQVAWFCYFMGATGSSVGVALGPLMTFLRFDMHYSYTIVAYHFSAWSLGNILTGFTGDKFMRVLGRRRSIWCSSIGLCLGLVTVIAGQHPFVTIGGAFLGGFFSNILSQTLCTILADRFSELRAIAITEANVAASFFAAFAPLLVGLFSRTGLGWRAAVLLPVISFCLCFVLGGKILSSLKEPEEKAKAATSERLPGPYWLCWVLIFLSVASEWSIIFWSADFLEKTANLIKSDAAICVTSFLVAMVSGRALGSSLARALNSRTLMRFASLVALSGFLIFWLGGSAILSVFGLFITGLGISVFYPLLLSMAIGSAPHLASKATSRMSLSSGCATLFAPLFLGLFAEHSGIFAAYGLVFALLLLCSIMINLPVWANSRSS